MKRNIAAVMAVSMAVGAASTAFAGGLTEPAPEPMVEAPVIPVAAPSGDWTGGYVGAQLGFGDSSSAGSALDGSGAIGGLHAGYRFDYGQFVLGAETSYDKANIDLGAGADSIDSVGRVGLTAGYDMGPALVYASGGLARASATVGGAGLSDNGYYLGLGADYALTSQWTVGADIKAHHFNDFAGSGATIDATTAQARISYRF